MKSTDLKNLKKLGTKQLTEWAFGSDLSPSVEIYINEETNEAYQVSKKHKKYRKTPANKNPHAAQKYGAWKGLV